MPDQGQMYQLPRRSQGKEHCSCSVIWRHEMSLALLALRCSYFLVSLEHGPPGCCADVTEVQETAWPVSLKSEARTCQKPLEKGIQVWLLSQCSSGPHLLHGLLSEWSLVLLRKQVQSSLFASTSEYSFAVAFLLRVTSSDIFCFSLQVDFC